MTEKEIPADVMEAAQACSLEVADHINLDRNSDFPGLDVDDVAITDAIARAIMAERERCATMCDALGAVEQAGHGLTRGAQNYFRARNAIRNGSDPETHYAFARGTP